MSFVILIGRILFGLIFVGSGVAGHLREAEATSQYAESRGVPSARLLTQISGVLILAGGLGVMFGVFADLAALGLVAYVLVGAFWVHRFWTDSDPMTQQIEMTNFMKNLSIAGGGIVLFALMATAGDSVGFTLTDPVFSLSL